jgi:hypothetical protein
MEWGMLMSIACVGQTAPPFNFWNVTVVGQFAFALKGHGFQPCRNCHKINRGCTVCEKLSFVSGHRFSDAVSALNSDAPLGAERRKLRFSANCLAAAKMCFSSLVDYWLAGQSLR